MPATASDCNWSTTDSSNLGGIRQNAIAIEQLLDSVNDRLGNTGANYIKASIDYNGATLHQDLSTALNYLSPMKSFVNYDGTAGSEDNLRYYLREILKATKGSSDILASNPWWATNSSFVVDFNDYSIAHPDDGSTRLYEASFPQFLSIWSSRLQTRTPVPSGIANGGWADFWGAADVTSYGRSGQPALIRRGYTWFDWMSDAMRSNWLLQASTFASSTNELAEAAPGYSDSLGDAPRTNALRELRVVQPDNAGVAASLGGIFSQDPGVDDLLPSLTSGSPEVVILDGGTVAGHTVPRIAASLNTPVVPLVHTVAAWAWRLVGVVMLWIILRNEYGYWSTLGQGGAE